MLRTLRRSSSSCNGAPVIWIALVLFALLLLAFAAAAYGVALYNALVGVKHQVDQAWSNIDVLLKQRHDELPKLIDVVKRYAGYEREVLEKVTALRARTGSGGPDARGWPPRRSCRAASAGCSPPPRPIRT